MNREQDIIRKTLIENFLSDEAAEEFDRIVGEHKKILRRRRTFLWSGVSAGAAAIVLSVILFHHQPKPEETPISPMVIAETISQIMSLSENEIKLVEAKPLGAKALLTVHLNDGSTHSYIMTFDDATGTTSLTASNEIE